jgi:ABC-type transporter Mla subunit MlaD
MYGSSVTHGQTMLESAINTRYQHYRRAVGLLALVTLSLLFVMLWMAHRPVGLFGQTYRLYGILDNVRHLQKTTTVTLAGLKIGEVNALIITDYNEIRIELVLDQQYQLRIRSDSFAQVKTDLLGNARIEISMGAPEQAPLPDGARIAFRRAPDLDVLIVQAQQELAQVGAVLANIRILTEELQKPDGKLLSTLDAVAQMTQVFSQQLTGHLARIDTVLRDAAELSGQLKPLLRDLTVVSNEMSQSAGALAVVSERIRQGQGVLGELTDSRSPLSGHILASVRKLDAVMSELAKLTNRLPHYGQQTERILQHTEQMMAQLAEASQQAPGLMDQSRRVAEDVDDMVGTIRRSPLLRALNSPAPQPPLLDAPRDMEWRIPVAPP